MRKERTRTEVERTGTYWYIHKCTRRTTPVRRKKLRGLVQLSGEYSTATATDAGIRPVAQGMMKVGEDGGVEVELKWVRVGELVQVQDVAEEQQVQHVKNVHDVAEVVQNEEVVVRTGWPR